MEVFRRRRLPHWDVPGAIYFVTACLVDSIPAQGLLELDRLRQKLLDSPRPANLTPNQWKARQWKQTFARADDWLDCRASARHLEVPELAACVVESMCYFEGARYELYAYVVMPSHFHWVFRPLDAWVDGLPKTGKRRTPRERIMHTLKLRTASECNKLRGQQGPFWQDESYDHCVFDIEELERIVEYVEQNPVKAGLVQTADQWPFSSVRDRLARDIPIGVPLGRSRREG